MQHVLDLIETNDILIVSGEGALGCEESYEGKRTLHAIKMRLTKERCGGTRWARAKVFSHTNNIGNTLEDVFEGIYVDVETGEYC